MEEMRTNKRRQQIRSTPGEEWSRRHAGGKRGMRENYVNSEIYRGVKEIRG